MNLMRFPWRPIYPATHLIRTQIHVNGRKWFVQSLPRSEEQLWDNVGVNPKAPTNYRKPLRKSDIEVKDEVENISTSIEWVGRPPRNEEIKLREVQLVDEHGKLHPPMPFAELLSQVDLKKDYIQLVARDKILVKVFNKFQEFQKEKVRKAAVAKSKSSPVKEIQMTWGVAAHDLAHKLNKVRSNLRKGHNVDVVFAPKKGTALPSPQEQDKKIEAIMEVLRDCAKEQRARTFERGVLTVHLTILPETTNV